MPAKAIASIPADSSPPRQWQRRTTDLGGVPVTIYEPAQSSGVVLVSHGIGEDRDSYQWLGERLAASGFTAVHLTHRGTDREVLELGYRHLYRATKEKENWIRRPREVSAVLDALGVDRAAVVGHSAGAFTAFAAAGLRSPDGLSLADPRVKVIVPMSMPKIPGLDYSAVNVPVLNVTGTCDTSLIYLTFPRHRRLPFQARPGQHLLTLRGVNHNTFSASAGDPHQDEIATAVIAFLRAFLLGDAEALRWFEDPGSTPALTLERN